MKILTIVGININDIPSLYAEINRVFMTDEDWRLGESLDALNDLLYGGYGAIRGREPIQIIWQDSAASRSALGVEATRAFLAEKLRSPERFNKDLISYQLEALERATGPTYFEIILGIVGDHSNIELVMA